MAEHLIGLRAAPPPSAQPPVLDLTAAESAAGVRGCQ
jgi:hypothetical protein